VVLSLSDDAKITGFSAAFLRFAGSCSCRFGGPGFGHGTSGWFIVVSNIWVHICERPGKALFLTISQRGMCDDHFSRASNENLKAQGGLSGFGRGKKWITKT